MRQDLLPALRPLVRRLHTDYCWVRKAGEHPKRINQPLNDQKLANHLNGGPAYGATPIAPGQTTTRVALLDLDSHKGETAWPDMQRAALDIIYGLEDAGLQPNAFRSSGGAGIHIYMLWDDAQDAYSVREAVNDVLGFVGFSDGTGGVAKGEVEIFPKQSGVPVDGFGSMFILPLAGKSLPLDSFELEDLTKEHDIDWQTSRPVPLKLKPETNHTRSPIDFDAQLLRAALAAIPSENDLSYDVWWKIVAGVHSATDGSAEGLALADEFSARSSKYEASFLAERIWPYIKPREDGITARTVFAAAREHGWSEDVTEKFDVIEAPAASNEQPMPKFSREKSGKIEATLANVQLALQRPDIIGARIGLDHFRDEIVITENDEWRAFEDTDYTLFRTTLESGGFKTVNKDLMRDSVHLIAKVNSFDSAIDWANGLKHDGQSRIETFLSDTCGVADTPYTRAVSRYLWTALAGRCLEPGVKADMVPVFLGAQGMYKSSAIAAMAPHHDFFKEISLSERDNDLSRKMRRCLVAEIAEMRGLHTKDEDAIKSFITRTHEEWTPKFKEYGTKFARRVLFIGSGNNPEMLSDPTGNRRWLPLTVERRIDTARIIAERDQLWAEGIAEFRRTGIQYQDAEHLAVDEHKHYMRSDQWEEAIDGWLKDSDIDGEKSRGEGYFTTADVMKHAIGLDVAKQDYGGNKRVIRVLSLLGYSQSVKWIGGGSKRVWMRNADSKKQLE